MPIALGADQAVSHARHMYSVSNRGRVKAGRHTAIVELCNDYATTCPGRDDEAGLDNGEDGKAFGALEDSARDDAIEPIITAIHEGFDCENILLGVLWRERCVLTYFSGFFAFLGQGLGKRTGELAHELHGGGRKQVRVASKSGIDHQLI